MPHFFINSNEVQNNFIEIKDKENYTHIAKSLRIKIGEKLLLIDENQIQYEGIVENIKNHSIDTRINKSYKSNRHLPFKLYLAQSPLRSDAQSMIIEKATELGVAGVYPILTDNCVLKKNIIEQKIPKWQKIMAESSKQCERAYIPTCFELTTIEKLIAKSDFNRIFAFTERDASEKLKNYLNSKPIQQDEKILVIIGPEGGFSQKEFDFFENNKKIITLSLGELILRAETAIITGLGFIAL